VAIEIGFEMRQLVLMKKDYILAGLMAGTAVLLLVLTSDISKIPVPFAAQGSPRPVLAGPPTAVACAEVNQAIERVVNGSAGAMHNPEPGVLVTYPRGWATSSQEAKRGTLGMLAAQRACAIGSNIDNVTVELRSITDNRLIGRGPRWNFEEVN
jgi:hypothetical protein